VQLAEGAKERDLEAALLADIERFMLALGEGFYFAGRQKSPMKPAAGVALSMCSALHAPSPLVGRVEINTSPPEPAPTQNEGGIGVASCGT